MSMEQDPKAHAIAREYKVLKEAFVSGLHGGSIWEINLVLLVVPICVFLWSTLQSRQSLFEPRSPYAYLIDFLLNVGGILVATTIYSSRPVTLDVLLLSTSLLLNLILGPRRSSPRAVSSRKKPLSNTASQDIRTPDPFPLKPFVTTYRGTLLVITCVCILAVDFKVFPRRFAKVETWGTSIMDIGVGSFVFAAGIVAARAHLKERESKIGSSYFNRFIRSLRHSLPLWILGLARLYSVKGLDYAEHITEYGVHWNFFFTLALLPPFAEVFNVLYHLIPSYAGLALVLGVTYEAGLYFTDLKQYILTAPRDTLISKNREGIFSFFGYLSIYLIGQATGIYTLPRDQGKGVTGNTALKKLLVWSAVWSLLTYLSISYKLGLNLQVSRRLANLPYILWIAAFNTCQLSLFSIIETLMFPHVYEAKDRQEEVKRCNFASSKLLRAFNRNALAMFLLANLLTGLVNLTLPTLTMNDMQAMAVLLIYMATLSAVALLLDNFGISLKF